MSVSSNLHRLQQIDSQIDQAGQRLREIDALLNDQTLFQQAELAARQADEQWQNAQKALRQAEHQVEDQQIKIAQTEAALYGGKVRNPKELQDLQHESAALKRYLSTLEDRELEVMATVEEAETLKINAAQNLNQVRAHFEEQHAGLRAEQTRLTQTQERLQIERQAAEQAIQSPELTVYTQLRKTRNGVAVARISERACSACGAGLTPAVVQSANTPNQIVRCPSCGRILYAG